MGKHEGIGSSLEASVAVATFLRYVWSIGRRGRPGLRWLRRKQQRVAWIVRTVAGSCGLDVNVTSFVLLADIRCCACPAPQRKCAKPHGRAHGKAKMARYEQYEASDDVHASSRRHRLPSVFRVTARRSADHLHVCLQHELLEKAGLSQSFDELRDGAKGPAPHQKFGANSSWKRNMSFFSQQQQARSQAKANQLPQMSEIGSQEEAMQLALLEVDGS